jgi:hypothetical protein
VKRKALELASLFSLGQVIVSSSDLNRVLERITQKAAELMEVKLCSLMLLDDSCEELLAFPMSVGMSFPRKGAEAGIQPKLS